MEERGYVQARPGWAGLSNMTAHPRTSTMTWETAKDEDNWSPGRTRLVVQMFRILSEVDFGSSQPRRSRASHASPVLGTYPMPREPGITVNDDVCHTSPGPGKS
ncbi:hypothetical protein E4U57_007297, partial [Claviceps arundinis]